jgi:serine/threonine protein kinase
MAAPLQPGALVARRFRLERPLGSGGMGTVWAATNTATRKEVALKFLKPAAAAVDDSAARAARLRLLREARAASAAVHPNIAAVDDVLELEDGAPVLVMDLFRGESLRARLKREGALPVREVARIMRQVLSALAAAHAVGVIHRDLKPDNIFLVASEDVDDCVKVLDFGVAKLTRVEEANEQTGELTSTGAMLGTPFYMAPEQAFGEKDIDARADLWAAGIVLYECLAGERPTHGDNLGQILKSITAEPFPPLEGRVAGLPSPLVDLVRALLARDRSERPASAHEAERVLVELFSKGGAALPPARPSSRRARRWVIGLVGVIGVAGVVAWHLKKGEAGVTEPRPEPAAVATEAPRLQGESTVTAEPAPVGVPSGSSPRVARRPDPKQVASQRPAPDTATSGGLEGPGKIVVKPPF